MHYYERNIGDYYRKAGRLNILQHGVYNLLIDACYDRERFPTQEEAIDWVWAETEEEIEAVKFVLKKFFQLNEDGVFVQTHIEEDLIRFKEFHLKQSENGKKGGRPKKHSNSDDSGNNGFENESQENPNETQNNPEKANESQTKPKPTNHLTNEPSNQIKNIRPPDGEPETAKNQKFKNEVQEIFEFWKFTLGKSNTVILSEARKSKILARLRQGYTVDNLKLAITNCSKSDYHVQGGYTDLELICRNEQKVDYFIAMSQQIQAPQVQAQLESPPVNPADFYEIRGRW